MEYYELWFAVRYVLVVRVVLLTGGAMIVPALWTLLDVDASDSALAAPPLLLSLACARHSGTLPHWPRSICIAGGDITRVGSFLRVRGCVVFDPWQKPGSASASRVMDAQDRHGQGQPTRRLQLVMELTPTAATGEAHSYRPATGLDLR